MKKLLGIFALLYVSSAAFSQVIPRDIQHRAFEPVVVSLSQFPQLIGKQVSQIYFYAYDAETDTWNPVPFQIDDRYLSPSGRIQYYFGGSTDTVDAYDELVFLIRDLGDRAPDGYWLANPESRANIRYEIEVTDTLNDGQKAWGYLFLSPTITDFSPAQYMHYDSIKTDGIFDQITTSYYQIGFADGNGLPANLVVLAENGGNETDLLDRFKFRVRISDLKVYGINLNKTITLDETALTRQKVYIRQSLVRIIRSMQVKVKVEIKFKILWTSYTYRYEDLFNFPIYFYPYNFEMISDNVNIDPSQISDIDLKIKLIRTSLDLNQNAQNMVFLNKFNRALPTETDKGNLIDGLGGGNLADFRLEVPGLNYFLITGDQGSIFSTTTVPAVGDQQTVYFFDFKDGDQTLDGTANTGEFGSWGDSGILITGDNILGEFKIQSNTYILPPNQSVELGDTMNANIGAPVVIEAVQQTFDITPPAMISDLLAVPEQDTSVTLIWTAPGDNGNTGTVDHYDIRYSDLPPQPGQEEEWFTTVATPATVTLQPQPAGQEQRVSISGLDPNKTYFFAVRAYDEADVNGGQGNASPISAVVSTVTFDVQLATFYPVIDKNSVTLYWQTASERENLGFEIQRRKGQGAFEAIGFVPGNGTTAEPQDYQFVDSQLKPGIYFYRLKQIDLNGAIHFSQEIQAAVALPADFALYQNYPNPFNPTTTIVYDVARESRVRLVVFDALGRLAAVLVDERLSPGQYTIVWDASQMPSGIYILRYQAGSRIFTRKMILLE